MTLDQRIYALLMVGHPVDAIADALGTTPDAVNAVARDLSSPTSVSLAQRCLDLASGGQSINATATMLGIDESVVAAAVADLSLTPSPNPQNVVTVSSGTPEDLQFAQFTGDGSAVIPVAAPSGGGLQLSNQADTIAGEESEFPANGTTTPLPFTPVGSLPSWLDDAGNIISPGIYNIGVQVQPGVSPTTPGLFVGIIGVDFADAIWPLNLPSSLAPLFIDTESIGEANLPFAINNGALIIMPTDATATITASYQIQRLAY